MSSPKFKLTILGIKPGYDLQTVKLALANSLNASELEVDALLQNQAAICKNSMEHQDAWMVKSDLLELGVDCQIKPVPLHGINARAGAISLQGADIDSHEPPKPVVVRKANHATRMRSGQGQRKQVPKSAPKVGVVQMAAMIGALALCVWFVQGKLGTHSVPSSSMASMAKPQE